MGTALATRPDTTPVRAPGDFARHPSTGAPQVTDPSKTRKPTGKKDELIAKAIARGLDVPAKITVAGLQDLLGPEMAMAWYGRPSSLGKQIENTTNLQKWSERATALGVYLDPSIAQELAEVDPSKLNLDDADVRSILDGVAVKAKNVAQAGIAAERGTHHHLLTEDFDTERDWLERVAAGEDLGVPPSAQAALVRAWEVMLNVAGLEILAVEATVVDDLWRQAGTLDRIARLTRDLRFILPTGEAVTLKAGTVIVLDVKTGKLRCDRGIVQFWHGYAVQVASYAQSVPYDPDTGERGEWEWDISQDYALIAHLDVLSALEGDATCRLVLVDLAAGREAGERCVWARQWENRTDVFSLVTDEDETCVSVKVSSTVPPAVDDEESAGSHGQVAAPAVDPALDLANSVADWSRELKGLLAVEWPSGVPTPAKVRRGEATWTDDELVRAQAAINEIVGPFDAPPIAPQPLRSITPATPIVRSVDDGPALDEEVVTSLLQTVKASPVRSIVNGWLHEAAEADVSWQPRNGRRTRHVEITRAAYSLASIIHDAPGDATDPTFLDLVRKIITSVVKVTLQAEPIGVLLAHLTIPEARNVAEIAQSVRDNRTLMTFSDQGDIVLTDTQTAPAA